MANNASGRTTGRRTRIRTICLSLRMNDCLCRVVTKPQKRNFYFRDDKCNVEQLAKCCYQALSQLCAFCSPDRRPVWRAPSFAPAEVYNASASLTINKTKGGRMRRSSWMLAIALGLIAAWSIGRLQAQGDKVTFADPDRKSTRLN